MKRIIFSLMLLVLVTSCNDAVIAEKLNATPDKVERGIIYQEYLTTIKKIKVDGIYYLVAEISNGGICIIKHEPATDSIK